MHPEVRVLYRELLHAARDYPGGRAAAREKLRKAFLARRDVDISDPVVLATHVERGRHVVRELFALAQLHKYRTLRKRYETGTDMTEGS